MKLDILAIGVHPDDVELGCSGTLLNERRIGKTTGVVDLTQGELGTRGTIETRYAEAAAAAQILGLSVRENLCMRDGFFTNDEDHQKSLSASSASTGQRSSSETFWATDIPTMAAPDR